MAAAPQQFALTSRVTPERHLQSDSEPAALQPANDLLERGTDAAIAIGVPAGAAPIARQKRGCRDCDHDGNPRHAVEATGRDSTSRVEQRPGRGARTSTATLASALFSPVGGRQPSRRRFLLNDDATWTAGSVSSQYARHPTGVLLRRLLLAQSEENETEPRAIQHFAPQFGENLPKLNHLFSDWIAFGSFSIPDDERNETDLNHNKFSTDGHCGYGQLEAAAPAPATDAGERSPPAPDPAPAGELAGELMATSGARGATSGASGASSGASGASSGASGASISPTSANELARPTSANELARNSGASGASSGVSGASSGASGANYETDNENNNKENY